LGEVGHVVILERMNEPPQDWGAVAFG